VADYPNEWTAAYRDTIRNVVLNLVYTDLPAYIPPLGCSFEIRNQLTQWRNVVDPERAGCHLVDAQ
jgi:hypothetical protein